MVKAASPLAASAVLISLASVTHAAYIDGPGECFSACRLPLDMVRFADMGGIATWPRKIASTQYMTSLVACMESYCSPEEAYAGWSRLAKVRDLDAPGTPLPSLAEILEAVPDDPPTIDAVAQRGAVFNSTICVSRNNFDAGFRSDTEFAHQLYLHNLFGQCMYALAAAMTLIGFGNRLLALAARRGMVTWTGSVLEPWPRVYAWYRRYIGTPAMFGYRNAQPWGMLTIPTRLQALLIFVYVALNVFLGCYGYNTFDDNLFYLGRRDSQLARYVADRTGIMSFYNMTLLWLLAGRNDVLLWLTGWSYPSLNLFHRWTARVATVQGFVHSAAYIYLKWGKFWVRMNKRHWWSGSCAMLVMAALIPLSILPLRRRAYEVFLVLHISLSVGLLALLCIHTDRFGYDPFVWACVGIWTFDRVLRLLRVAILSYRTLGARNAIGVLTALKPGLMRLSVDTSVPISPRPGDNYFLYSPHSLAPWENHPFTLASWEERAGRTTLHFLIAPQAGWTGRLRRRIEAAATKLGDESALMATVPQVRLRILLEGPYGNSHPVDDYDHVLLVAGGSGIAAILPYIFALGRAPHKRGGRRITVLWTVRNAAYAVDVLSHELSPERTAHIGLQLYLTQEEPADARAFLKNPDVTLDSKYGAISLRQRGEQSRPDVSFQRGRPNLRDVLAEQLVALGTEQRLAVLACGPGSMMDDLRSTIAEAYGSPLLQADPSKLEYWLEYF